jgi:HPt (histidine-containing phosphotransfer) domain-containing protein
VLAGGRAKARRPSGVPGASSYLVSGLVSSDLDPAAIARLERLGGLPLAARMVDLFLRQAPPKVAAIRAALTAHDADAVAYWAHGLVASSSNLGATRVWELVRQIEAAALAGRWEPLPTLVDSLEPALEVARVGLAAELERRQG